MGPQGQQGGVQVLRSLGALLPGLSFVCVFLEQLLPAHDQCSFQAVLSVYACV